MEYVAGKTLDQLIGRKRLRLNEVLKYAVQIADALARAHAAGIIHRDLKPSNLMIDDHGLVKVLPKRSREGEKLPGNFKSSGDPVFHARTAFLHYVFDVWVEAARKWPEIIPLQLPRRLDQADRASISVRLTAVSYLNPDRYRPSSRAPLKAALSSGVRQLSHRFITQRVA